MKFNEERFRELILHITDQPFPNLMESTTRLSKQLFFCDFLAYRQTHEALTGARYIASEQGPTPDRLHSILARMTEEDQIDVSHGPYGERVRAIKTHTLGVFTIPEIHMVHNILYQMKDPTVDEVDGLSYRFIGWKTAIREGWKGNRAVAIPYNTVYTTSATPSDQEVTEAVSMAEKLDLPQQMQAVQTSPDEETDKPQPETEKPKKQVSWTIGRAPNYRCDDQDRKRILVIHEDLPRTGIWRLSLPDGSSTTYSGIDGAVRAARKHLEHLGIEVLRDLSFIKA